MTQKKNLDDRAYISYHQDGIIDIMLGGGLIGFGLQMLFDSPALMVLTWMPFLLYMPMKNHITAPRFSYINFTSEQAARTRNTRTVLIGMLVFFVALGLVVFTVSGRVPPEVREFASENVMLLMGLVAAFMLLVAGAVTGIKRLYVYAGLSLLFNAAGALLPIPQGVTTTLLGLTILISGFWLMSRFLRAYPLPDEGDGLGG